MEIRGHPISKKCFAICFKNDMILSSIPKPVSSLKSALATIYGEQLGGVASVHRLIEVQKPKSPLNFAVKLRNTNKNRSMDHNNLSIQAILTKNRRPSVASLCQRHPSCFHERCSPLDSQRVNESACVIRSSLSMMLCE